MPGKRRFHASEATSSSCLKRDGGLGQNEEKLDNPKAPSPQKPQTGASGAPPRPCCPLSHRGIPGGCRDPQQGPSPPAVAGQLHARGDGGGRGPLPGTWGGGDTCDAPSGGRNRRPQPAEGAQLPGSLSWHSLLGSGSPVPVYWGLLGWPRWDRTCMRRWRSATHPDPLEVSPGTMRAPPRSPSPPGVAQGVPGLLPTAPMSPPASSHWAPGTILAVATGVVLVLGAALAVFITLCKCHEGDAGDTSDTGDTGSGQGPAGWPWHPALSRCHPAQTCRARPSWAQRGQSWRRSGTRGCRTPTVRGTLSPGPSPVSTRCHHPCSLSLCPFSAHTQSPAPALQPLSPSSALSPVPIPCPQPLSQPLSQLPCPHSLSQPLFQLRCPHSLSQPLSQHPCPQPLSPFAVPCPVPSPCPIPGPHLLSPDLSPAPFSVHSPCLQSPAPVPVLSLSPAAVPFPVPVPCLQPLSPALSPIPQPCPQSHSLSPVPSSIPCPVLVPRAVPFPGRLLSLTPRQVPGAALRARPHCSSGRTSSVTSLGRGQQE